MALIALLFFLKFSEQIVFKGYLVKIRFCNPSDQKTHMQCVIHVGCWELYSKHLHLWKSQPYDGFCTVVDRWFKHPTQLQKKHKNWHVREEEKLYEQVRHGVSMPRRKPRALEDEMHRKQRTSQEGFLGQVLERLMQDQWITWKH